MKTVSFVIPCYRSERTISSVIDEIISVVASSAEYDYEIVAVNDFSPDNVFEVLKMRAKHDKKIKAISLAKNFGQHAGIMAGLKMCKGDFVVFLDDDGQCPVDKLAQLLAPLEQGADVVIARYGKKKQSWFKNLCSQLNEISATLLIDKPKDIQMGNFFAVTRIIAEEMRKYCGPYPYMGGLFFRCSGKVVNVPMEERSRQIGSTNYTFRKLFSLWLNSFTAFSIKPLRVASVMGFMASFGGFIYGLVIIIRKLLHPEIFAGWSSIMAVLLLLGGMILIVLGIIGEYIGRIYMSINGKPQYVIKETVNCEDENP